jgi:stage II sporulation protein AA (anti-sigma F factor antagonist)
VSDLANLDIADHGDGIVVARVEGDLDLSNLHSVYSALLQTMPNEAFGLVVDLAEVHFLDSSGVETLFRLRNSLGVRQQRFAVVIPPGAPIRRALELSGTQGEIPICQSVGEAVALLRAGPGQGAQETG